MQYVRLNILKYSKDIMPRMAFKSQVDLSSIVVPFEVPVKII